jgi:hypothetical protein
MLKLDWAGQRLSGPIHPHSYINPTQASSSGTAFVHLVKSRSSTYIRPSLLCSSPHLTLCFTYNQWVKPFKTNTMVPFRLRPSVSLPLLTFHNHLRNSLAVRNFGFISSNRSKIEGPSIRAASYRIKKKSSKRLAEKAEYT